MMPRLPAVRPRQFVEALKKAGFGIDHQTGSHVVL
jgi:predicted RNA binding protein YcfA (HicA-like mRNA interferase family)